MTRVVVIGDVHGNARALRAALAQARTAAVDRLVFVGDLLTYGHDTDEVLELVSEAQAEGASLLIGNHDQMYFDVASGNREYLDSLPEWIRDSVELTLRSLDLASFRNNLVWNSEIVIEDVLVSHAGPFGRGDWTYVAPLAEHQRAAEQLALRGLRGGVFGHTHRARWFTGDATQATADVELDHTYRADKTLVANAGAIGQPRDKRGQAVLLRLELRPECVAGSFEPVNYDVAAHVDALRNLPLPSTTIERLCSFFRR